MKTLLNILANPVTQLLSFAIIMIGGQIFVLPYGWMIRYALPTGEPFAIVGIISIAVTLISLFFRRRLVQTLGLAFMWLSLLVFFAQLSAEGRSNLFQYPIEYITLLVFIAISAAVIRKKILWKNY